MNDLADLVRRRRLALRLTQREAADRAELSLATWQNVERPVSTADGFQDLTLARVAHGLGIALALVFEAAGRPLPDDAGAAGDMPGERSTPPGGPGGADAEELIAHLAELLRTLARTSPASFQVVYGQAAESAQHLLDVLAETPESSTSGE